MKIRRLKRPISALAPKLLKLAYKRLNDAISKLYNIIVFILIISQRGDVFITNNVEIESEILRLVKENNIRWFFTYLMLIRAVLLKDSIDLYILRH